MSVRAAPAGELPVVLYLVGCGRSGSTLAERMLGSVPRTENVGELARLFASVASEDQRCGCGRQFSECPFWRAVGDEAFGGWSRPMVAHVARLQRQVVRQRFVPYLVQRRMAPASYRRLLKEYAETYGALYSAIGKISKARVLIDASKSPTQLLAMGQIPDLDLRVLNIVRDSRGVAHSWNKSGVRKPHDSAGTSVMRRYAPSRTALLWSVLQLESAMVRSGTDQTALIRYEDLVTTPKETLQRALFEVGLPAEPASLDHIDGRAVTLGASHGLSGNPSRFSTGRLELSMDREWCSALAPRSRRLVTALTLPQLLGYGYVGRPKVNAS